MEIQAQALINKMTTNYGQSIAAKDQQLAMSQVQIEMLTKENNELKAKLNEDGKKAK